MNHYNGVIDSVNHLKGEVNQLKRLSVGLPPEIENLVIKMRKTDEYCMCSYADILRKLMLAGAESLEAEEHETQSDDATA